MIMAEWNNLTYAILFVEFFDAVEEQMQLQFL